MASSLAHSRARARRYASTIATPYARSRESRPIRVSPSVNRLGHQHAIEGIVVMARQITGGKRMLGSNRNDASAATAQSVE